MARDEKLRELIRNYKHPETSEEPKQSIDSEPKKRKGINIVEIDNDNGMCTYDYLYNDF